MAAIASETVVAAYVINGRKITVNRTAWRGTDGLSYDVVDVGTGLCLTPTSLDAEPSAADITALLDELRADVADGTLDPFYAYDGQRLTEALRLP